MDRDNTFVTCTGLLVSVALVALLSAIMGGWALSTIWNWYVPPLFHLTTLTFAQAIGVSLVLTLFTGSASTESKSDKNKTFTETLIESVIIILIKNVFYVLFAWVVLQFAF